MQPGGSAAAKPRTAAAACQVPAGLSGFARYTTVAPRRAPALSRDRAANAARST